ncbi:4Fe-4S ferredoxin N-terminal domain-containing protein [Halodesulfurarchaeum sp. HSR-GB]|uniref:4Fe-4S ferredoxin N-terminal domain-containing protein n=1 Tax=Halodesulfurarchaeum sp. HSR-GB TaxID=3074077 RepID=UPI00285D3856|nr:4Fe-4S ferredoxin N-terminal domain-containing protein [Halodesulfurarchaeum sp. HSR-GB]MDR5655752.1 4Fe-4S ferredoxin N-terminal domain-containing protein [Halodesulfurarchaeum sp. HSR-GB]
MHTDRGPRTVADLLNDEDWQETVDDALESSAHDTELGKRMGRDAIRLSIGEMSEDEFHEKYHEDVVEEFGVDDRPIKPEHTDE